MDNNNKVIDISCFLLLEATGDSETLCFDPAMSVVDDDDDDDDDAESCSCDTPGVRELNELEQKVNVGEEDDEEEEEEEGKVVELQKEPGLHKNCRDGSDHQSFNGVGKGKKPSSASVDSPETLNEKNRLFWEACLAS
ncbi:hypothetical protein V6N13_128270 [Hibiscus sabdariffa]|uniref:Uncharacterized protein n=1 Tax=Hibiscus sabdariffa TaxID=183260 RepID=A0ABR2P1B5_9ROSI